MATRSFSYSQSDLIVDLKDWVDDGHGGRTLDQHGRLEAVAQDIAIAKAEAVCKAMLLFAAARVWLGKHWTESSIAAGPARLQKTSALSINIAPGSGAANAPLTAHWFRQEAAHLLPGNLLINGHNSWDLIDRDVKLPDAFRLSGELMEAFADTSSLPACFNKADSEAENGKPGLKAEFATAVRIMGRLLGEKAGSVSHLHSAIRVGLARWFEQSHVIYRDAAARKLGRSQLATKDDKRSARYLESRVLAEYSRSLLIRNPLRFIESNSGLRETMRRTEERVFTAG